MGAVIFLCIWCLFGVFLRLLFGFGDYYLIWLVVSCYWFGCRVLWVARLICWFSVVLVFWVDAIVYDF